MHNLTNTNMTSFEVNFESGILFSTASLGTFTILAYLLYYYAQGDENSLGTPSNIAILFFGILTTSIADFLVYDEQLFLTYEIYMFTKTVGFGSLVMILAPKYLFTAPSIERDEEALGAHHKSVSLIVLIITIPLVLIETGALIISYLSDQNVFYAVVNVAAIFQKLIQGGIYHFILRHKVPIENKKCAASWFFKIMSLFNFSLWLQSIIEAEQKFEMPVADGTLKDVFTVFKSTYSALMIDYRLLCCLLFMEHSYEINHDKLHKRTSFEHQSSEPDTSYTNLPDTAENFFKSTKVASRYGYLLGAILLMTQFVNAIEYLPQIGPWVNVFGFFSDISVAVTGYAFIKQVRVSSKANRKWRESNSKGIDLMVAMMGVTGLAFWLLRSILLAIWSTRIEGGNHLAKELPWLSAKSFVRSFVCLFHIYLYTRTDLTIGYQPSIKYNRTNHFLIPVLMLSFLSVFINSVIDSYNHDIKGMVKNSNMNIVLFAFYEAAIPIHLGFVLHLFIHYLLINNKMVDALAASEKRYRVEDILAQNPDEKNNLLSNEDDEEDDKTETLLGNGKKFRSV